MKKTTEYYENETQNIPSKQASLVLHDLWPTWHNARMEENVAHTVVLELPR